MNTLSQTAMVLAAGLGTRMRPLTHIKPKPLQVVGGRTMLDHAIDKLIQAGVTRTVVNTHHLPEQIEEHLRLRRDIEILISREDQLLDTGGGIAKVLPAFENKPFFVLNADLPWFDEGAPSLTKMREIWDADRMDVLLLLMRTRKARGFDATKGDFDLDARGHAWRNTIPMPRPFVFISAQILKPDLFAQDAGVFSNSELWSRAEDRQRLFGVEHEGTCYHVGTPEDLLLANELLSSGAGWSM